MAHKGDLPRRGQSPVGRYFPGFPAALATGLLLALATPQAPAQADETGLNCEKRDVRGQCTVWDEPEDSNEPLPPPDEGATWTEERWLINCSGREGVDLDHCADRDPCPEGEDYSHRAILERDWVFQNRTWVQQNDWQEATPWVQCRRVADEEITEEQVRRAVERFGMKPGEIETAPPGGKTLVDFDTVVWTEQGPYEFELDLAGTAVELMATPERYHWDFGDGHDARYDTPGVPYAESRPMNEYHTHSYERTGEFDITLTIDYHVRWNAGNGWQSITDTISSQPDQAHTLQVVEKHNRLHDGG